MRIQNNITAMNTHRMYTANNNAISKSAERLSSGYRINRAGDDAAGLAISEKMRSQIRGLNMASKNSQDANSLIQTAEGALQEVHSMLQRMNELANQSATGTNEDFDRTQISAEFDQLKGEIDDISTQTNFNNMKLLDGSLSSKAAKVQVADTSAMAIHKTLGGFTITGQTGLSGQVGTYEIANNGDGKINVTFTDTATANETNTIIDLNKSISGDLKAGGSFKVDLSAAGMGVFEMTADNTHAPTATALATAWVSATALQTNTNSTAAGIKTSDGQTATYTPSATAPAGTYSLSASGSNVLVTDEQGNTATFAMASDATALDLGAVSLGDKTVNLGSFAINGTAGTASASQKANIFDGVTIKGFGVDGNAGALKIQVGANEGEQLSISVEAMNTKGLGIAASTVAEQGDAGKAITATQEAINLVSEQRSTLGAMQNRLEHKISNLDNTSENLSASESRIRDVDIAKEMTAFTKNQILSQASTAMLAQANSMPQNVLSLLQ